MSKTKHSMERCPISTHIPAGTVDDDGFCSEHGWQCDEDAGDDLR